MTDDAYAACVQDVHRDLITTTAAIAALASFLMGLLANLPVGMAPGLGLNAYVSIRPPVSPFWPFHFPLFGKSSFPDLCPPLLVYVLGRWVGLRGCGCSIGEADSST